MGCEQSSHVEGKSSSSSPPPPPPPPKQQPSKPTKWESDPTQLQDGVVYEIEPLCAKGRRLSVAHGKNGVQVGDSGRESAQFVVRQHGPKVYSFGAMHTDGRKLIDLKAGLAEKQVEVLDHAWNEKPPETALFVLYPRKHGIQIRPLLSRKQYLLDIWGGSHALGAKLNLKADAANKLKDDLPQQLFHFFRMDPPHFMPVEHGKTYEIEPRHAPGMRLKVEDGGSLSFRAATVAGNAGKTADLGVRFKCHRYSRTQFLFESMQNPGGFIDSHDSLCTQCPLRHCGKLDDGGDPPPATSLWKLNSVGGDFCHVRSVGHPPKRTRVYNVWECYGKGTREGTELITREHEALYPSKDFEYHRQFRFIPVVVEDEKKKEEPQLVEEQEAAEEETVAKKPPKQQEENLDAVKKESAPLPTTPDDSKNATTEKEEDPAPLTSDE